MTPAPPSQGSPEWHAARRGKITGSRLADALTVLKSGKWAQTRENYMVELIAERLTGATANHYTNKAMEWGSQTETDAVSAYEFMCDIQAEPAPFTEHPTILGFGATPDRFIGDDGMLEIKCRITREHIQILLAQEAPPEFFWQVWGELACTGRKWCDLVFFDPRLPPEMQMFVQRIERDEAEIAKVEDGVREFLTEMDELTATLWRRVSP